MRCFGRFRTRSSSPTPDRAGIARRGPTLSLVCALALGGAACGRGGDPDARVIELWTLSLRPTFTAYMEGMIDRFERVHPGVRVRWVDVPFGAVDRKLVASAAAGQPPDVINLSDLMFARYASVGALGDLSKQIPVETRERYLEAALRVGRIGDRLLALPWYLTTQTLLVNEALLAEGGLTTETLGRNWRTLRAQAGPFHKTTGKHLFSVQLGEESHLPMMLMAEGLAPFERDGGGAIRASLTRAPIVAFVRTWVELYRAGALPREAATQGHAHLTRLYQSGRVAAINTSPNFLSRIGDVAPSTLESTAVLPAITGELGATHIATMMVAVSAETNHPSAAAALAAHLTSPEAQLEFCRLVEILPSTRSTLEDPLFEPPSAEITDPVERRRRRARSLAAEALETAVAFTPSIEAWPDMRRAFDEQMKRVLLGELTLEAGLRRIEDAWNRMLEEANARRAVDGMPPIGADDIPIGLPKRAARLAPAG